MKNILITLVFLALPSLAKAQNYYDTVQNIEVLPASQQASSTTFSGAMGYSSAVTISSSAITRIDTAFNAVVVSTNTGLGPNYKRAEITIQNNDTTDKFCGFSATGLTIANSYKVLPGSVWTWKVGKGMGIYCLNATSVASGTLIVGGVAWN